MINVKFRNISGLLLRNRLAGESACPTVTHRVSDTAYFMEMIKRFLILLVVVAAIFAQDTLHRPEENQIPGPRDAGDFDGWFRDLKIRRAERLTRMGYNDAEYARPELQWAQRDFVQPQMMCEERYFYDPVQRRYTVDRYLDDLEKRYGGIDSVLIWPVYPNIGIDNRNEWDLHRDLPGGIPALKKMVDDFHRRGVRVLRSEEHTSELQ